MQAKFLTIPFPPWRRRRLARRPSATRQRSRLKSGRQSRSRSQARQSRWRDVCNNRALQRLLKRVGGNCNGEDEEEMGVGSVKDLTGVAIAAGPAIRRRQFSG